METAQVRIRPLRLAFLVDPRDKKSLHRVFEVNSSLWGGIYNFIIPLFKRVPHRYKQEYQKPTLATAMLQGFVEAFQPDFVVETKIDQIKSYGIDFPSKRTTSFDELLGRDDGGRCNVGVDLRSVCNDLYRETFKFVQRHPPKVVIPTCTDKRYGLLFAAMFGTLPEKGQLSDVADIYLKALEGERKSFPATDYPTILAEHYYFPLRLTAHKLETYRNDFSIEAHLFYMDETSALDLIEFWNYRALGWKIVPLPARLAPSLVKFCEKFVAFNHRPFPPPSNAWHMTSFLCAKGQSAESVQKYLANLKLPKEPHSVVTNPHVPRIWEEWGRSADHAKPQTVTHASKSTDAHIFGNGLHLSAQPHEFGEGDPFCSLRLTCANVIESISGKSPVIPWNRNVAAKLTYSFGEERAWISREGIVTFAGAYVRSVHLRMPSPLNIFGALAEASGFALVLSPAGRVCEQIIAAVGSLGAIGLVARSPHLLGMLDRLAHEELEVELEESGEEPEKRKKVPKAFIPLRQILPILGKSNPGNESVTGPHLGALIRSNVLKLGMALKCSECLHTSWFSLEDLAPTMRCPRCLTDFSFPAGLPPERAWAYRVTGPFATARYAHGAYCVAAALQFLDEKIAYRSSWLPSFEMVKNGVPQFEADFGMFVGPGATDLITSPYLIIGECKSFNRFEKKDFERAQKAAEMYPGAVLCFCTFNESLEPYEIRGLKRITEAGRNTLDVGKQLNPVLILTARELFGQFKLDDFSSLYGDKSQYADSILLRGDMCEICEFTQQLYLGMKSSHEVYQEKHRKTLLRKAAQRAKLPK